MACLSASSLSFIPCRLLQEVQVAQNGILSGLREGTSQAGKQFSEEDSILIFCLRKGDAHPFRRVQVQDDALGPKLPLPYLEEEFKL